MTGEEMKAVNGAALLRLKDTIDKDYSPKQFVAIAGGKIVADDADLFKLVEKLQTLGIDSMDTIVDRAGEPSLDYIEFLGITL